MSLRALARLQHGQEGATIFSIARPTNRIWQQRRRSGAHIVPGNVSPIPRNNKPKKYLWRGGTLPPLNWGEHVSRDCLVARTRLVGRDEVAVASFLMSDVSHPAPPRL
jgi:hypothetical protein